MPRFETWDAQKRPHWVANVLCGASGPLRRAIRAMIHHKQFTTGTGRSGAAKYFTEHLSVSDYVLGKGPGAGVQGPIMEDDAPATGCWIGSRLRSAKRSSSRALS